MRPHPHLSGVKFGHCDLEQLGKYIRTGAPVLIGCDSLIAQTLAPRLDAAREEVWL